MFHRLLLWVWLVFFASCSSLAQLSPGFGISSTSSFPSTSENLDAAVPEPEENTAPEEAISNTSLDNFHSYIYQDDTVLPAMNTATVNIAAGCSIYASDYTNVIFPQSKAVLGAPVTELSGSACPGEIEPVVMVIRTATAKELRVTVSELSLPSSNNNSSPPSIPSSRITVSYVRFFDRYSSAGSRQVYDENGESLKDEDGNPARVPVQRQVKDSPLILERRQSVFMSDAGTSDTSQPVWITVDVPSDTLPGTYQGMVNLREKRGAKYVTVTNPPIKFYFTVRSFHLEPSGKRFSMCDYLRRATKPRLKMAYRDLLKHGMTQAYCLGAARVPLTLTKDNNNNITAVSINWKSADTSPLVRNLAVYQELYAPAAPMATEERFTEPFIWDMTEEFRISSEHRQDPTKTITLADRLETLGLNIEKMTTIKWDGQNFPVPDEPDNDLVEKIAAAAYLYIKAIYKRGQDLQWPPMLWSLTDELYAPSAWRAQLRPMTERLLKKLREDEDPNLPKFKDIWLSQAGVEGKVRPPADAANFRWQEHPEYYQPFDQILLHDGPALPRNHWDKTGWNLFYSAMSSSRLPNFQASPPLGNFWRAKKVLFYNIDSRSTWHPEPLRFMYGLGLWKSGADGLAEWTYQFALKDYFSFSPGVIYRRTLEDSSEKQPTLYRYPRCSNGAQIHYYGGPTVGYELIREGIDDYRYLVTLRKKWSAAHPDTRNRLLASWRDIQSKIASSHFAFLNTAAYCFSSQNWTGGITKIRGSNDFLVKGNLDIDNGIGVNGYRELRELMAALIEKL